MRHPLPWSVKYWHRCDEWHLKSCPYIVDADGKTVVEMKQYVGHPGEYDEIADLTAHQIIFGVNGNHNRGRYIGVHPKLKGETALLIFRDGGLCAQFDNIETGLGFGWHPVKLTDFEIQEPVPA